MKFWGLLPLKTWGWPQNKNGIYKVASARNIHNNSAFTIGCMVSAIRIRRKNKREQRQSLVVVVPLCRLERATIKMKSASASSICITDAYVTSKCDSDLLQTFEWPLARNITSDEAVTIQLFNYNKYLTNK